MNTFEKNIDLLSRFSKHYLEEVTEQEVTDQYALGMLENDLVVVKNNLQYRIPADQEIEYVKASIRETNTLYFYVGLSCISSLKYLLDHTTESSKIIVLEKNKSLLAQALYAPELTSVLASERVTLYVASESSLYQCISEYLANTYLSVSTVAYFESYLYAFERDWVKSFETKLAEMVQTSIFMVGNDMGDTLLGLKHNIMNIDEVLHGKTPSSIKKLNLYQGKAAIIVAAGPSLNKQLPILKKLKGKALIFVADGALKVVLDAGIVPDAVCTTERVIEIYNRLYCNLAIPDEVVFLGLPIVHPNVISKCKNKVIAYRKGEPICEWFSPMVGNDESFEIGMSCVHIGFSFAEYLGCSKIILIGQDLAYGEDGQTHAVGASHEIFKEKVTQLDVLTDKKTKGYYGGEVYAEKMWHYFRVWYEQMIRKIQVPIYNCTEGGAYIEGAIHTPFAELYEEMKQESIVLLIDAYQQAEVIHNPEEVKQRILADLHTKISDIIEAYDLSQDMVKQLSDILKKHEERNEQVYSDQELEAVIRVLNDCDQRFDALRSSKDWIATFFQSHVNTLFQEMAKVKSELCAASVFAIIRAKLTFFAHIHADAKIIVQDVKAIVEEIG